MAEINKVVAHFSDGRVLKGSTQNFLPNRGSFHLLPADGGAAVEIAIRRLKALYFVRDFAGDAGRRGPRGFADTPADAVHGRKLAVRFADGELLCGYSLTYLPGREGFFLFPADAGGNNLRVFVVAAAAVEVRSGPAADALVQPRRVAR